MTARSITPQVQACVGLVLLSLATLGFHALCIVAYRKSIDLSELDLYPEQRPPTYSPGSSALGDSQFQAILSSIDTLATSLVQINDSLHTRISSELATLHQQGGWYRLAERQNIEDIDGQIFIGLVFLFLWVASMAIVIDALDRVSRQFVTRALLSAFLAADVGMAYAVFCMRPMRWYFYVLSAVWPFVLGLTGKSMLDRDGFRAGTIHDDGMRVFSMAKA